MTGKITRISGPVVGATDFEHVRLNDIARVGELGLIGEVIRLTGDMATIQVYEETSGVRIGEPVENTGLPLVATLGPGLLGQVYDGLQRPLEILADESGYFIQRGESPQPLTGKTWPFTPAVEEGDHVEPSDVLGTVPEGEIEHRVSVPAEARGRIAEIHEGEFNVEEGVAVLEKEDGEEVELTLSQKWPVRKPRPVKEQLTPHKPVITGTRVIDTFFPVAKGGTAIIPGGFGTGKTVAQQSLARWSDVDIVVYVGCGERGNEMTEVLEEFPELEDPRTGEPLMKRTVLIANTSDMPVAAREASIYTGITIAEYYRDIGYHVLMLADSTSRWGEALREISGRLEEMPGEEGYPAYLAARLAEFYERAGLAACLGSAEDCQGSVTVVGAVSPPGGDFSEPITQNSMRLAGTFWALDTGLARRRHFPAIHWTDSYSQYDFGDWYQDEDLDEWNELTRQAMVLLRREEELQEIIQLVGPDALSEKEQAVTFTARMLREDYLQQSAFHEVDRYCPLDKGYWMLKAILRFYELTQGALEGDFSLDDIRELTLVDEIARMKEIPAEKAVEEIKSLIEEIEDELAQT
ncbi:MAG: V-type ATP synthase subunit A [Anaerolineales bacterium]|jgi:V/A-type H+-transporting ATPase subunit A